MVVKDTEKQNQKSKNVQKEEERNPNPKNKQIIFFLPNQIKNNDNVKK